MTRIVPLLVTALALLVPMGALADHHDEHPRLAAVEASAAGDTAAALFALEARRLNGGVESLSRYRGNVVLVVNTASRCGLTPQYEGLQALYSRYRERGFVVLGFPSNDFAGQEPGTEPEIGAFCKANYGVEFPMFSKVKVNGEGAHPVYTYLTGLPEPLGGPVAWNFQKYLVDRSGRVVHRFEPRTKPEAPEVVQAIERLLAETPPLAALR